MDDLPQTRSNSRGLAGQVRRAIPVDIFAPATSRLLWLPTHAALITLGVFVILTTEAWPLRAAMALLLGMSFSGLAFLAHEALHGAVVRQRSLRWLVGFLGFLPFALSPVLWVAWHNREHHGHTNEAGRDPDAYPTLEEYDSGPRARLMVELGAPGLGRLRGLITLLVGFTVQSLHMLVSAGSRGYLRPGRQLLAVAETCAGVLFWGAFGVAVGGQAFLFAYVIPLAVANVIVMVHITTNHSLSPLTPHNEPLLNSLTVTTPRWFSFLTLEFGFHVEHHLFPAMSGRFAPRVSAELRRLCPESYQALPLLSALRLLHRTARVYKSAHELVDPRSGRLWATWPLPRLSRRIDSRLEPTKPASAPMPTARRLQPI